MVSLIVHAVLGLITIALIVKFNPAVFRKPAGGPAFSALELAYYVIGIASIALGYYFNTKFVMDYQPADGNPLTGPGSWSDYIRLMFVNPAASSAGQDYTIINVILLPLFTIADGLRRGIRHPWLFFVSSLFTSCAFALAFYFAVIARQQRHERTAGNVRSSATIQG
ncbi:DUF2834 domain-containing protein [Mycobacterium sp. CBMA293]|uniref:DUF2834 domain-containing protein n=1 Tax=unclassified Mycolicibacterium TaxID=2636767 RepID=UPI0012DF66D5|nr:MULTISPECIES: DUF2834 domain-containing protein [unclassified Mycolicibacterium]MUL50014.1 DUF2834 domain-containing protein [Mycolicibacterium sp. CBMA 360]MUL61930.1 DUF2834 domain-containing protein [Mycolicibacterium sp. CBMA 335]MUL72585.1 DUF2834 domain-containing protein [Mycolicibacterium sp. CBMA 311]MUL92780.1 DUF2834 domain-containing protein [Mycolicibacterium sp. CBMA 230]MUM08778.1 hypothetical protein [Mycolicibacterium sp. CBMA 213]